MASFAFHESYQIRYENHSIVLNDGQVNKSQEGQQVKTFTYQGKYISYEIDFNNKVIPTLKPDSTNFITGRSRFSGGGLIITVNSHGYLTPTVLTTNGLDFEYKYNYYNARPGTVEVYEPRWYTVPSVGGSQTHIGHFKSSKVLNSKGIPIAIKFEFVPITAGRSFTSGELLFIEEFKIDQYPKE